VYAEELLHNRIGTSSVLALHMDHDDLNNQQRALLTCLADTVSNIDFDHMVRACIKGNALPTTAGMYFSKPEIPHSDLLHADNEGLPPLAFTAPMLQDAVMHEAEPEVQLLAPAPVAEQLLAPSHVAEQLLAPAPVAEQLSPMISYAAQSPPRPPAVHVNPPGSASRTINLKGGAGKRRKTVKNAF
jgi:hypothetical protein